MVVIICVAVNIVKLLENRRGMGDAEGLAFIRTLKKRNTRISGACHKHPFNLGLEFLLGRIESYCSD